jgi:hypothetical protein
MAVSIMKKQEVLEMLDRLPDQFDPEQLMGDLYLRAKLESAEAAVSAGKTVRHEQVVEQTQQWFK